MSDSRVPEHHVVPWVDLPHGYLGKTATEVGAHRDLTLERCWLDPAAPRDATILYRHAAHGGELMALVWDEDTGWRDGRFVTGQPGVRTTLTHVRHLGGGLLPAPAEVLRRLRGGQSAPATPLRSHTVTRDGFDDLLAHWSD